MAERKRTSNRGKRRRKPTSAAGGTPNSYKHLYKGEAGQSLPSSTESVAKESTVQVGKDTDSVDWKGDYSHVIRDLRTLFIVSILIFVAMIGAGYMI